MGDRAWVAVAAAIAVAGCINIPPPPCADGDADCDGWPAISPTNVDANDCDDNNPAINPGANDDPGTPADDDCTGNPSGPHVTGVGYVNGRLVTAGLDLQFDSVTAMPSSLRIGGIESLHTETTACDARNEEGLGISLYPTFAAHATTEADGPHGTVTVERAGPAMATVLVAWLLSTDSCNAPVTLTANVRFTALPDGRIVRDDTITVGASAPITTCVRCDNPKSTSGAILSSYTSLEAAFDMYDRDQTGAMAFPVSMNLPPPVDGHQVCVRPSDGVDHRRLGQTWHYQAGGGEIGVRLRNMTDTPSATLTFDIRNGTQVEPQTYQLISTLFGEIAPGDCTSTMWARMAETATPANSSELVYDISRGYYVPLAAPVGNAAAYTFQGAIAHGVAVRVDGVGTHGVTVWLGGQRLAGGVDYLIQHDADGAYLVWMPAAIAGATYVIAGPGGEPSG